MLVDALGRPLRFIVTDGQVGDITQASAFLKGQAGNAVLADKAYDSNALRETIAGMGAEAVITSNRSRKTVIPHDKLVHQAQPYRALLQPNEAFPSLRNTL
jgi:transposase